MSEPVKEYPVKWSNDAKLELKAIFDHIKYKSLKNARLIRKRILDTSKSLKTMPERYEVYEPMRNIPGNYRVKEVSSYLVIYDVTETEVHVVKVMHFREQK